jgi:hypothetical protein
LNKLQAGNGFFSKIPETCAVKMKYLHLNLRPLCIAITGIFTAFLFAGNLQAQYVRDSTVTNTSSTSENSSGSTGNKLVPGGNFGFGLGNQWFIDLSPSLGYQLKPGMVAGAGIVYNAYGGSFFGKKYRFQRYGGMLFARHRIYEQFFASTELEMLNVPDEYSPVQQRVWIFSPLAGLSYVMPFQNRGGLQISLLYNLNHKPDLSPYPSPLVWRIGFFL